MPNQERLNTKIILRGVGQVIFQESALSGFIMLVGIACNSLTMGLYALLGTIISTATAKAIACRYEDIERGLFGFNGTLVGIAVATFCGNGLASVILLLLASVIVTYVTRALMRQSVLPGLTAPFVLVAWGLLCLLHYYPSLATATTATPPLSEGGSFERSLSLSLGQIMLQGGSLMTGFLFLLALTLRNLYMPLHIIVVHFLSWSLASLLGASQESIDSGLWGYNAILTYLAVRYALSIHSHKTLKALVATALSVYLQYLGLQNGLPTLTAPFVLATWSLVLWERYFGKTAR